MAESPLHELDAWLPFAEALRRTAPDGTAETVFTGTLSPSSWGGSTLDDGDHEARWADRSRESRDLLHDAVGPLLALTGGREHGVRVAVTAAGDVRVRIVDIPVDASFSMSGGLGSCSRRRARHSATTTSRSATAAPGAARSGRRAGTASLRRTADAPRAAGES